MQMENPMLISIECLNVDTIYKQESGETAAPKSSFLFR